MATLPVRVFIRAKPTNNFASKNIKIDENKGEIMINIPKDASKGIINHQQENWQFNFDKILMNTSQEMLFALTAKDIVHGALDGYSGTVIAYG
jgi:kinesin family member 6/9